MPETRNEDSIGHDRKTLALKGAAVLTPESTIALAILVLTYIGVAVGRIQACVSIARALLSSAARQ